MDCPFCEVGQAILMHKDKITKDGVHLGPTYSCNNPDCFFFSIEGKAVSRNPAARKEG